MKTKLYLSEVRENNAFPPKHHKIFTLVTMLCQRINNKNFYLLMKYKMCYLKNNIFKQKIISHYGITKNIIPNKMNNTICIKDVLEKYI